MTLAYPFPFFFASFFVLLLLDRGAAAWLAQQEPRARTRGAPKFPQAALFELLWRAGLRNGERRYFAAVEITLDHICEGGIYDHLGGGFSRYSVDERWLVPPF